MPSLIFLVIYPYFSFFAVMQGLLQHRYPHHSHLQFCSWSHAAGIFARHALQLRPFFSKGRSAPEKAMSNLSHLYARLPLMDVLWRTELRLRLRRLTTLLALLAVIAISWAMIPDPRDGDTLTLMTIRHARVLYNSSALALGSAKMAALLLGLAGFYLLRGRAQQDIRTGIGSVIAATQISNRLFLCCRWLGGVAYLLLLTLALLLTIMLLQSLRGVGSIELSVYLQTYCFALLPVLFLAAGCAILFDSWAPLMGKAGDVLFFVLWMLQFPLVDHFLVSGRGAFSAWMFFDFSGLSLSMLLISAQLGLPLSAISKNLGAFDPALASVSLPAALWTAQMMLARCVSAALALLPLLLAMLAFHRYAPDRVKVTSASQRATPVAWLNRRLHPCSRLVQPLFRLAARSPGCCGQVLADVALSLATAPAAIVALILVFLASLLSDAGTLPAVAAAGVACWGILISEISSRDFAVASTELTDVTGAQAMPPFLRHVMASVLLGCLFIGVIGLRWAYMDPLRAAALVSGLLSLSALATLLGSSSRGARTFLALFLFALYVAINARLEPMFDLVGFNGVAHLGSVLTLLLIAVSALIACWLHQRRRAA